MDKIKKKVNVLHTNYLVKMLAEEQSDCITGDLTPSAILTNSDGFYCKTKFT